MARQGQGNFINGAFIDNGTITVMSNNPSSDFAPVFTTNTDIAHVRLAIDAAVFAKKAWGSAPLEQRIKALMRLKAAFIKNEERLAAAISAEMGKVFSESMAEAKSLSARIDLMIGHGLRRVQTESLYELRGETRYHRQGALAVIGPYNFPAHLINAHVIPSLLLGNSVVIKPSETCPMSAEIYAECLAEAGMPKGVANLVQGGGDIGRALCADPNIDGVLFTGSYKTGRVLKEMMLDQPHKIMALEMGGKNFAVVMDDAHIEQAALEIITGAYLTTGQRCTATSRVLIHERLFKPLRQMLIEAVRDLRPVGSMESGMFGPLAHRNALEHFLHGLNKARSEGAEVLIPSEVMPGGAFVTPSIYQVEPDHPMAGYLGEELFGPNIAVEVFSDLDRAIERIAQSPYGLANSIFTLDPRNAEVLYRETRSGVLNINRSTNNALGQMPFGGVNRSGNQRPAGIDAVRYTSYPVACLSLAYGESNASTDLKGKVKKPLELEISHDLLALRHEVEALFEDYGIFCDRAALDRVCFSRKSFDESCRQVQELFFELDQIFKGGFVADDLGVTIRLADAGEAAFVIDRLCAVLDNRIGIVGGIARKKKTSRISVPEHLALPRSRAMLDRLYHGHFVPQEKKALVADLCHSRGPYLASIDDDPLVLFDAASQIATVGAGFRADTFLNAYDSNELDIAILENCDLSSPNPDESSPAWRDANKARAEFEEFLHERSARRFCSISYGASGAEANEIAFDLARRFGPGGTKILAFEGAFHGRTIMALQATYNKEKRGPFAFSGYEATFLPFPELKDPRSNPPMPQGFLRSLARGIIPEPDGGDSLLDAELRSLSRLRAEATPDVCAVIIEPMQCEGGDRYVSDRFLCGLRALTRALKIPLVFDEVQTGFHLGREFFWYRQVNLIDEHGMAEAPDIITLAKKAQLGVCLSVWPQCRSYTPHIVQLKRGLLHAKAMEGARSLAIEEQTLRELAILKDYFPSLVSGIRACGFAFAFDLPSNELAQKLLEDRFNRGFMAYIAGEKTLRFRLNMATDPTLIKRLFERLFLALMDLRDGRSIGWTAKAIDHEEPDKTIEVRFAKLTADNFNAFAADIKRLEDQAYESGRRDSMESLFQWLQQEDSLGLLLQIARNGQEEVAGFAIGGPLENAKADGPAHDKNQNAHNTFYSADVAIDDGLRGLGLGRQLKAEQIRLVSLMKRRDGNPRYLFMTGRNRVGRTEAMQRINDGFNSYIASRHHNQYGEKGASAHYYRLPLKRQHEARCASDSSLIDCRNSLQGPFAKVPQSLVDAFRRDRFRSLVGSKLTLSNWATPNLVRYSELLRKLIPKHLKHAYFTSGRDEALDKGLRSLRFHRSKADIAIGFSHQWLGNVTAAARSLSHDDGQAQPFAFFGWPRICHPAIVGIDRSLKELREALGGLSPDRVLGVVVELVGERSGLTFPKDFLAELHEIRKRSGIPLIFVDNASSLGRSGLGPFLSDAIDIKSNIVLWYTGGQLGHVLVDDQYFVEKPLTLISTWDGDEISITRSYHNLLRATSADIKERVQGFEKSLAVIDDAFLRTGIGAWQAFRLSDRVRLERAIEEGRKRGVLFGQGFDHALMVCPRPDIEASQLDMVIEALIAASL